MAELANAHGAQIQDLLNQIDDKNRRLANPEEALAQQHALIVQLEEKLAKRGNEIGGDARAEADAAMKAGEFDKARELFAQIAARTAPDVSVNADAEYALGLIAEEQVRWGDAADHFERAARLNPSIDTLAKAGMFLWRAGRHGQAIAAHTQLVALAKAEFGPDHPKTATAMNNLAESLRAAGQYDQAEPLCRQAMEIRRKTLGEDHPDYASSLNNLAGLLRATGRYDQGRTAVSAGDGD
ncbi:MAG: tetratricopeptide repeat protein [Cypionkella sp.]|nr:tetratricopeptide repeat protein [Cypionkella sp.]